MAGRLHIVGTGPGDPELLTLKAARIIGSAPVVAYFARRGRTGHAHGIAAPHVCPDAELLRFEYPYTTEIPVDDPRYMPALDRFYDASAAALRDRLAGGDAVLLCEGDPFFFGSAMHVFDRLAGQCIEVVPGITAMSGCWSQATVPIAHGDDVLTVLPGTLPGEALLRRLQDSDAAVVMKLGGNLPKVRAALAEAGLLERAILVEFGTMAKARLVRLADAGPAAPYFSLVLVPGRRGKR